MATAKPANPSEEKQPALFSVDDLPTMPVLVEATKRYMHTGKIATKDEERAAAIAEAFLETGLVLRVAKRFHCSPHTVNAIVEVLQANGKLDDLKQRVSRKLGLLAEVSAEAAIDKVEAGLCPANVLPINLGVALDKKALIDGEPTQRIDQVITVTVGAQDVLAYLSAKGVPAPTIDVESAVSTPKPLTDKATP